MLAQWQDVELIFHDKHVLRGISFGVRDGDRLGLIGENGSGKTCVLRMLLGKLSPSAGKLHIRRNVRIGYLDQNLIDTNEGPARTCWDVAASVFTDLIALEKQMENLSETLAATTSVTDSETLLEQLGAVQVQYEQSGGYTFRARIEATLQGLNLGPSQWEQPVSMLSAGEKVRLALARLLLGQHDLLLLDEPTNHLDTDAREWLQRHLREINTAYIVVSHDRVFLDAVVDQIAHLHRGNIRIYRGNYSAFHNQRESELTQALHAYEHRQRMIQKLEAQARKYETWSHRTEKKKQGAPDKGAVGRRAAKLMKRSMHARRLRDDTIEKMRMDRPETPGHVAMEFQSSAARTVLTMTDVHIGYEEGAPFASDVSFALTTGQRLAVTGPNGSGKSTLLNTALGLVQPLRGEVRLSPAADVGYFEQDARGLAADVTALQAVKYEDDEVMDETLIRTVMGRLRIMGESVHKRVGQLSAGERAKVLLAKLMVGGHNFLILDEPTNHLDIDTQDALLASLLEFPGAILFVSHDRYFVDKLATDVIEL